MLAASADGGLGVTREQSRIRAAVERALHNVELDVRPSATTDDLLDGITRFRPHVVHFSGHSSEELVVFEENVDINPNDVIVSAEAFAAAVSATHEPPLLVFLNSCRSAAQIETLVERVAPFAIGMSGTDRRRRRHRLRHAVLRGGSKWPVGAVLTPLRSGGPAACWPARTRVAATGARARR